MEKKTVSIKKNVNEGDFTCVMCQKILTEKKPNPDVHKEGELIKYIKCTKCGNEKVFNLIERDKYDSITGEIVIQWQPKTKKFVRWILGG